MSQLRIGAVLSYFSIIISMLIALVYTPIMIRLLGQSEFGLYSLIGSLAAYFSIMDMGLGNAMIRFTARNRAVGNNTNAANLNGLFLMFYSIIGFLVVIVGIIVYRNITVLFEASLTESELSSAKIMIIILIINFSLSFPLSIFNSLMKAYERFIAEKLISIIKTILSPLMILPIIYIGYGAVSMVIITTIINIMCLLYSAYYCFKNLNISITFGKLDLKLIREILGYSFFVFLAIIVDQIYWQTDQIILGIINGTMSVAIYAIAIQFIRLYIQFSSSISGLFLPKITMMVANKVTNVELTNMMVRYGRIQYLIITLILSGFILFGETFIIYWAGSSYSDAYYIVLIIMIPLTIPLIQNVGISILYAMNLQMFRAIVLIIIAILNIVISIPVAKTYGGIGVAFVTAGTLFFGNFIIMNIYYHRRVGINVLKFWGNMVKITMVVLLTISFGFFMNYFLPDETMLLFMLKIIIYISVHLMFIYLFTFNEYEKEIVKSAINRIKDRM